MKLSSARELKATLLQSVRASATASRSVRLRGATAARVTLPFPRPVLALGIGRIGGRKRDYRLAVRVYKGRDRLAQPILKKIEAKDQELDLVRGVRYVPRQLTVRAGGSCGHYNITAGTLGGFVEDDEQYYILSNNHVLADRNQGHRGDPILQPGPLDIEDGRYHVIGYLERWDDLSMRRSDGVDAALAVFSERVRDFYPWQYRGIGQIDPSPVSNRYEVASVVKRGRTTGVTRGTVSAYELDDVAIDYGTEEAPYKVLFDNQIEIVGENPAVAFSDGGDSGSFIMDADTLRPYALLYGGGPDRMGIDRTVAHFMQDVLAALKVRLVQ